MVYLTFYLNEKLFNSIDPHLPSDDRRQKFLKAPPFFFAWMYPSLPSEFHISLCIAQETNPPVREKLFCIS